MTQSHATECRATTIFDWLAEFIKEGDYYAMDRWLAKAKFWSRTAPCGLESRGRGEFGPKSSRLKDELITRLKLSGLENTFGGNEKLPGLGPFSAFHCDRHPIFPRAGIGYDQPAFCPGRDPGGLRWGRSRIDVRADATRQAQQGEHCGDGPETFHER